MPLIRAEQQDDIIGIRKVIEKAFGRSVEADLVDALRSRGKLIASTVAEKNGIIVGHVAFSSVVFGKDIAIAGLAPLAVHPEFQGGGIGGLLVKSGLRKCQDLGYVAVVILGDPPYYSRFGFQPASRYGLSCEYPDANDYFMVVEFAEGALRGLSGLVRYQPEFRELDC